MKTPSHSDRPIGLALLGCGTVGSGLLDIVTGHSERLAASSGGEFQVIAIVVRCLDKERDPVVRTELLTTDASSLIDDPRVDIVVELMGGIEPARTLVMQALRAGKAVVTANKAIIARFGPEFQAAAEQSGGSLHYEAAAAGAIPVVKVVAEALRGNQINELMGIVNGTCNYILTEMTQSGAPLSQALSNAQRLGYAEADPSSDIGGEDAAYKLTLLARLAFGARVDIDAVHCEGIDSVSAEDISRAQSLGYVVKLLAVGRRQSKGLDVRVHPTLVPAEHPLAAVHGAFNAVYLQGDSSGPLMLYGQGAGRAATASAVAADVIDAARAIRSNGDTSGPISGFTETLPVLPIDDSLSRYYICLKVADEPGVLAAVANVFGEHQVSVASCLQEGQGATPVDLIFVTHTVRHGALMAALAEIGSLSTVVSVAATMRVLR